MTQTIPIPVLRQRGSSRAPLQALQTPARSLYIHVPFCFHKCHYCDFYSIVDTRDRQRPFLEALLRELRTLARHNRQAGSAPLRTVFVGGGTPTLLQTSLWRRLLHALRTEFDLSEIETGRGEFTVECNPETVTPELMNALRAGGVNRVSVGAQTFDPRHLKTLERRHEPRKVAEALAMARDAGIERRSLDLIYAIPGQTLDDWRRDLDAALACDPGLEHISAYGLIYEPNTAMTRRLERGEFEPVEDDLEVEMLELAVRTLTDAGFERYEISNFARGERARSLHNLAYWRSEQWLPAGPSASGHVHTPDGGAWRWTNVPRLEEWMRAVNGDDYAPTSDIEAPDPRRALQETLMMGLRLSGGLAAAPLLERARALGVEAPLLEEARRQADLGRLVIDDAAWRPTPDGMLFANALASELMQAVEAVE